MALINCEECGKEISDRATACPSCGAPTKLATIGESNQKDTLLFVAVSLIVEGRKNLDRDDIRIAGACIYCICLQPDDDSQL
jgi:uncharacterized OB-fold protein